MRAQQQLNFNKTLNLNKLVKILIDPAIIITLLFVLAVCMENKLESHYIVLSILVFTLSFPGSWINSNNFREDVVHTFSQWFLMVGILLFFGYSTAYLSIFSHQILVAWILMTPFVLLLAHWLARCYLLSHYYFKKTKKTAVIVGCNELALQLKNRIEVDNLLVIEVKGFFDDSTASSSPFDLNDGLKIIGTLKQLSQFVSSHAIDIIYITLPPSMHAQIMLLLDDLKDTTASIYFVPNFFIADLIQGRIDEIGGMPVVAVCETPFTGFNGFSKRVSDILISSFLLCILLPVFAIIAAGVKLSSTGPVLFKQRRYGLDGQEIVVYKFRSMTVLDNNHIIVQATINDKRVTPFGKFIRKTSLDELPQFINVLQGRMSVVGPRPHAIYHNEIYRKSIKGYMIRHKVKPGITGWAQVNGFRGETKTVENMKLRIDHDLDYLKNWSLILDIKIILKTITLVFKDSKAY